MLSSSSAASSTLQVVLHRIVEAAVTLVDAEYGALGVIDADGHGLSQFITVGIDDERIASIGPYPTGRGILGEVIRKPEPLRLTDIEHHAGSYGFPPNHPPMRTFLGVPVRVRDRCSATSTSPRSVVVWRSTRRTRRSCSRSPARQGWPSPTPGCTRRPAAASAG